MVGGLTHSVGNGVDLFRGELGRRLMRGRWRVCQSRRVLRLRRSRGCRSVLLAGQVEQRPIAVPFQEYIEPLQEAIPLGGIVAGDVFEVGAQEDQAAGALLAFGGAESGLGAADLLLQIVALAALGILHLLFLSLEFLLEGFFPGEQLFEFFLWFHRWR